jgi:hypothetical protein
MQNTDIGLMLFVAFASGSISFYLGYRHGISLLRAQMAVIRAMLGAIKEAYERDVLTVDEQNRQLKEQLREQDQR